MQNEKLKGKERSAWPGWMKGRGAGHFLVAMVA